MFRLFNKQQSDNEKIMTAFKNLYRELKPISDKLCLDLGQDWYIEQSKMFEKELDDFSKNKDYPTKLTKIVNFALSSNCNEEIEYIVLVAMVEDADFEAHWNWENNIN